MFGKAFAGAIILAFSGAALCAADVVPFAPVLQSSLAAFPVPRGGMSPTIPDGLGVNIHFTDPKPGEVEMLAEGGFRWVRMDLDWAATERQKGLYDFSAYDRLMKALEPRGIRALFILDYGNDLYEKGRSPSTEGTCKAMAAWAAAAVRHFQGRGCLWEMWNEPNIVQFWKPQPNAQAYVRLATEVGKAIRAAAPEEQYIGPAASTVDLAFLEACFKGGLLEYWQAVSVHPYRQSDPETAAEDYQRLRRLIEQYAPKDKTGKPRSIPILSGEWGYSSAWAGYDAARQGRLLPRQWLVNLANDVPLSIWYDWRDDSTDPKDTESNFGTVLNPYHGANGPAYVPKPAYLAARTLTSLLAGFTFQKRLTAGEPSHTESGADYVLLFTKGNGAELRLAAWTTGKPHDIIIPAGPGAFKVIDHVGKDLPVLTAEGAGLKLAVTDAVQYLVPEQEPGQSLISH